LFGRSGGLPSQVVSPARRLERESPTNSRGCSEEVEHGGVTPEVEEVLADSYVAGALALAGAEVCEAVLDGNPFAELGSALDSALARAEFNEEGVVGVDRDAALGRDRTLGPQRAGLARGRGKPRDGARDEPIETSWSGKNRSRR